MSLGIRKRLMIGVGESCRKVPKNSKVRTMVHGLKDITPYLCRPAMQPHSTYRFVKQGSLLIACTKDGIPVGTRAEHMVPLSKNAHTGNAPIAAHVNPISGMIDEGVWQGSFDGSEYGDDIGALTDAFREQSAEPQIRLAELASMQPEEMQLQQKVADAAGVRPQALMISAGGGAKTEANKIKAQLAKQKFDMPGAAAEVYGEGKAPRGGSKTSNSSFLTEDRPDTDILRRDNGLSGNEEFAQDTLGKWIMVLKSNNPRRRM